MSLSSVCVMVLSSAMAAVVMVAGEQQRFNKLDQVVYVYPGLMRSDRQLPMCTEDDGSAICSIVHRRFWLPPLVQRICRCPAHQECPYGYNDTDGHSMLLDNRSQLKFCNPVTPLESCSPEGHLPALTVTTTVGGPLAGSEELSVQETASAACYCPWPSHWRLARHYYKDYHNGTVHTTDQYRCLQLERCTADEFCGHIRPDLHSTYYRCSCPQGLLCLNAAPNGTLHNATELFYAGPMHRATCHRLS